MDSAKRYTWSYSASSIRIRRRRKPRPLLSILVTAMRPIMAVEATWVPPSAWTSIPLMSTDHLDIRGQQVTCGADDVRDRHGLLPR